MNDELVTARAAVVSKLLVIAPYSADSSYRHSGVQIGEKPRQNRSADESSGGLLRRVSPSVGWSSANHSNKVSKAVITSAAFVASGTERVRTPSVPELSGKEQNKDFAGEHKPVTVGTETGEMSYETAPNRR